MHYPAVGLSASYSFLRAARRGLAAASPLVAATLLTAAVFLLPAPGTDHRALASAGQIESFNVPAAFH